MNRTIFYSWQSDLSSKSNLYLIEDSIKEALKKLSDNASLRIDLLLDKATRELSGSPDIAEALFKKISNCSVFIADISFINYECENNRKTPNPNVLIELGYAARTLGWEKIICIFNEAYGNLNELPFDLRNHRIMRYNSSDDCKQKLSENIRVAIRDMHDSGVLTDKILDYLKKEIDQEILSVVLIFSKYILPEKDENNVFKDIQEFLALSKEEIFSYLKNKKVLGFYLFKQLYVYENKMKVFVNQALSSHYYKREILNPLIDIYEWFGAYSTTYTRYSNNYLMKTGENDNRFLIIPPEKFEFNNELQNRYILGKKIDEEKCVVINFGDFPSGVVKDLTTYYEFKEERLDKFSECIYLLIESINNWLDVTNGEFICDFVRNFRIKQANGEWL
jgi:hypothetical protein